MAVSILNCTEPRRIHEILRRELREYRDFFPKNNEALIVVKPNLNSSLDALTGNTTDLRVLSAVLAVLKEKGYKNVLVLEGPNGGFHRDGINVFRRNAADKVTSFYGYNFRDVNFETDTVSIEFEGAGPADIAATFLKAALFINMPKMKTHYETLISVALKSLIGILVGQLNKAKTHASLYENILRLNDTVQPQIHIVDGLIAMEGTGPSAGKPIRTDVLLVGTDAYEIDIVAGALMGFSPKELPLIELALTTGRISESTVNKAVDGISPILGRAFRKPTPGILARIVLIPKLAPIVREIRNSTPIKKLLELEIIQRAMLAIGLTQEVMIRKERNAWLKWNADKCDSCGRCAQYCPQLLKLPEILNGHPTACVECFYCYAVCPVGAIEAKGEMGFYKEQEKRYQKKILEIL